MKTNDFGIVTDCFVSECGKIKFTSDRQVVDLTPVLNTLRHLRVDCYHVIECLTPGNCGIGGESTIYARQKSKKVEVSAIIEYEAHRRNTAGGETFCELDPLNWVTIDGSRESVWEYHLFVNMWRFLPLWWHANYARIMYITDADVVPGGISGDERMLPDVTFEGDIIKTTYCFWTEWGGLFKVRSMSEAVDGKILKIGKDITKNLVSHNCGILF